MRIVSFAANVILLPAVTAWAQTPITIFGNAVPQNPVNADSAVTLGVKFYSTQAGTIAGIRFYRGHSDSNGYTVKLFSSSGTLLGSATAARDTCSVPCWEQINFASPISIAANTTYVAAYYASNGDYADDTGTSGGLTNGASNGPLVVPASAVSGGNGVYLHAKGFPKSTWENSLIIWISHSRYPRRPSCSALIRRIRRFPTTPRSHANCDGSRNLERRVTIHRHVCAREQRQRLMRYLRQ